MSDKLRKRERTQEKPCRCFEEVKSLVCQYYELKKGRKCAFSSWIHEP